MRTLTSTVAADLAALSSLTLANVKRLDGDIASLGMSQAELRADVGKLADRFAAFTGAAVVAPVAVAPVTAARKATKRAAKAGRAAQVVADAASAQRGGPSQVAKASSEATPEEIAERRFGSIVGRYAATIANVNSTADEIAKAKRLSARLTYWLLDRGSYIGALSQWGVAAPDEAAAREAKAMAREARIAAKPAKVAAAKPAKVAEMTLADFLATGGTLVTADGKRISR